MDSMRALVEDQRNWVCNTANASSLLWHLYHSLPNPAGAVNWAGFYVVDKKNPSQLILGPFHGKVACQTIKIGSGVCGTVAKAASALVLDDVEAFPGHIACDGDSKSEIVVPILVNGQVKAPFITAIDLISLLSSPQLLNHYSRVFDEGRFGFHP